MNVRQAISIIPFGPILLGSLCVFFSPFDVAGTMVAAVVSGVAYTTAVIWFSPR